MGIPSHMYPHPSDPPDGHRILDDDELVAQEDLVWSTATATWHPLSEWGFVQGTRARAYYGVSRLAQEAPEGADDTP